MAVQQREAADFMASLKKINYIIHTSRKTDSSNAENIPVTDMLNNSGSLFE